MTKKEEQLHTALKDAITHYRAFVVKNQPRNDIAMVSDIQFEAGRTKRVIKSL